jgi:hypothetical protein
MCASSDLPEHVGHCTSPPACNSANPRADDPAYSCSDYPASGCALLFTALHMQRQFVLMADGVPVSVLVTNLPSQHVWVRKEYLRDLTDGHGEFVKGIWVSAKSIPGRALYFETYLPDYAAMFDKLPISAFVSSPEMPDPDLPLTDLQFWNCMDYGITAIVKQFTGSMTYEARLRSGGTMKGTYVCTLDNYHASADQVDYSTSETPAEHKSMNIVELENGQFAAYPNNRLRIYDVSLTPAEVKTPDFLCSTHYFSVEGAELQRYGDCDVFAYE